MARGKAATKRWARLLARPIPQLSASHLGDGKKSPRRERGAVRQALIFGVPVPRTGTPIVARGPAQARGRPRGIGGHLRQGLAQRPGPFPIGLEQKIAIGVWIALVTRRTGFGDTFPVPPLIQALGNVANGMMDRLENAHREAGILSASGEAGLEQCLQRTGGIAGGSRTLGRTTQALELCDHLAQARIDIIKAAEL